LQIDIQTHRVHFLGRSTRTQSCATSREAQAVEDILQTEFGEIEPLFWITRTRRSVAFVVAPSVCEGAISVFAPAPAKWAGE